MYMYYYIHNNNKEFLGINTLEQLKIVENIEITHKIIVTHHTYQLRDVKVLKETHWFFMHFDGAPNTIPQLEEGITQVSWKSKDESMSLALKSYPSILSVFDTAVLTL